MLPQGPQFKTDKPTPPPMPGTQPTKPPAFGSNGYVGPKTTPSPKPTPLTPGQKKNAELDDNLKYALDRTKSVPYGNQGNMNDGWISRGAHHVTDLVDKYDSLMAKVGEKSPRYNEFLAAKQRTVAGALRMVEPPAEMPHYAYSGVHKQDIAHEPGIDPIEPGRINKLNAAMVNRRKDVMSSPENTKYFANKKKK